MATTSGSILISAISLKALVKIVSHETIFPNVRLNVKSWSKFMK